MIFVPSLVCRIESNLGFLVRSVRGVCLNGGTSVPSVYSGKHLFCMCPDGFGGKRCEIGEKRFIRVVNDKRPTGHRLLLCFYSFCSGDTF